MSSTSAAQTTNNNAATNDPKQLVSPLDALGEDDEFEDFPVES